MASRVQGFLAGAEPACGINLYAYSMVICHWIGIGFCSTFGVAAGRGLPAIHFPWHREHVYNIYIGLLWIVYNMGSQI
jgi:hypothetical protein